MLHHNILTYIILYIIVVDCEQPPTLDNGTITISTDTTYKAIALYECHKGFRLQGPELRSCLANGSWSDVDPFCRS